MMVALQAGLSPFFLFPPAALGSRVRSPTINLNCLIVCDKEGMLSRTRRRAPTRDSRDFHLIKPEYGENSLRNGLATGALLEDDPALISSYVSELRAIRHISGEE